MGDGMDYGPGNVNDAGSWFGNLYPQYTNENDSMFSGWSQTAQDIAKIAASTWAQTSLMQKNLQGQQFIEGQRLATAAQQRGALLGGIPLVYLLIGGALLFFMMKD